MKAKVKVTVGLCTLSVLGMDMNCPLCGVLVKSGNRHACEKKEVEGGKKLTKRAEARGKELK